MKNWIIKKLGGFTASEYSSLQQELAVTNKLHEIAVINREVKTLRIVASMPEHVNRTDFDFKKYAMERMADKIINSGALHVTENLNYKLALHEFEATLKVVI